MFLDEHKHLWLLWPLKGECLLVSQDVADFCWHDSLDLFLFLTQDHLNVCYSPEASFLDSDLSNMATIKFNISSKHIRLSSFSGSLIETLSLKSSLRQNFSLSPQAFSLLSIFKEDSSSTESLGKALKLVRFCKDDLCWSILASRALSLSDLLTAEVALAALNLVDKVRLINQINSSETNNTSSLETFLFLKKQEKAARYLKDCEQPLTVVQHFLDSFLFTQAWQEAQNSAAKDSRMAWLKDYVLHIRKRFITETCSGKEFEKLFERLSPSLNWEEVQQKKADLVTQ